MKEPGFKKGYDALEEEVSLASQLIALHDLAPSPSSTADLQRSSRSLAE
jgi:hypothetical protein